MPIPAKYQADFAEGGIYHVYNRTNNKELLFRSDDNRYFFLKKCEEYLNSCTETFCWCLLPNHFHMLIRVRQKQSIMDLLINKKPENLTPTEKAFMISGCGLGELVGRAFKNMFQSYSQAFNKQHSRNGNLCCKPFKRVEIKKDEQLTRTIIYIHANPQKHGLVDDFRTYPWSSYNLLARETPTRLLREEVIKWFGSAEQFQKHHLQLVNDNKTNEFAIEK